jgi:imidazolonepropionase-like amidohydrolase
MIKHTGLALFTLMVCTEASWADPLAIVGAKVFDATGSEPYMATVVINDGIITSIDKKGRVPRKTKTIDAKGLSLLPGFFDLHVHYTPRGEPGTSPQISQAYIEAGVTSVYDFAQAPEAFAPRREWLTEVPGPHVNFAARMSTTNGHGADWSDTNTTKWVNTPYAATEAVKELLPYKPDVIKVFTDGWRYGSGVDNTSMDEPTLTALVAEAHANNLKVLTHTVTVDRAAIAGRAGVDVLAHSMLDADVDQETIDILKASGTAYAGTLAVYEADKPGMPSFGENTPAMESRRARFATGLRNVKALHDNGILIALGTDAGMPLTPHGKSTLHEMELMVKAGLTPTDALMAGTSNSAKAVGIIDDRGTIEVGKAADIVLIKGEPWSDISELYNTAYTFVGGELMFGKGAPEPVTETYMTASKITSPLIADFDGSDTERTNRDTLVVGDPDGGKERSWQVYEVIPETGKDGVLHLTASLSLREEARAGVVLPLNRGDVQPADASAYKGLKFDIRGDGGDYVLAATTTEGTWTKSLVAGEEWSTVEVPFDTLGAPAEDEVWSGDDMLDVRFLIKRPGGDDVWMEVDDVSFY